MFGLQLTLRKRNLPTCDQIAVTGIIGKKTVEVGQNVSIGQELVEVVPLDDVWVTAHFKETQLAHMRPDRSHRNYRQEDGRGRPERQHRAGTRRSSAA